MGTGGGERDNGKRWREKKRQRKKRKATTGVERSEGAKRENYQIPFLNGLETVGERFNMNME